MTKYAAITVKMPFGDQALLHRAQILWDRDTVHLAHKEVRSDLAAAKRSACAMRWVVAIVATVRLAGFLAQMLLYALGIE